METMANLFSMLLKNITAIFFFNCSSAIVMIVEIRLVLIQIVFNVYTPSIPNYVTVFECAGSLRKNNF